MVFSTSALSQLHDSPASCQAWREALVPALVLFLSNSNGPNLRTMVESVSDEMQGFLGGCSTMYHSVTIPASRVHDFLVLSELNEAESPAHASYTVERVASTVVNL